LTEEKTEATIEAILFASDSPAPVSRLARIAELPESRIKQAIEKLNEKYERTGNSFRIKNIAGGYQLMSTPEYHSILKKMKKSKSQSRLSRAAMETLAIVAYRQPIIRADIESIRGVACGELLRGLLEKQLVKIVGRAQVIGRPMLYGTTKKFLEIFGLASIDDLPRADDLRIEEEPPKPPAPDSDGEESDEDYDDEDYDDEDEEEDD
jgi:segregation and condensation protein B